MFYMRPTSFTKINPAAAGKCFPLLVNAGLVVLELNTQPGMTKTSLVPEQAKACDISFEDLCRWIVEDASCDR